MRRSRAARSHGGQEGKLEEAAPELQASLELSDADIEKLIAFSYACERSYRGCLISMPRDQSPINCACSARIPAAYKHSVFVEKSLTSERRNQVCRLTIATAEP